MLRVGPYDFKFAGTAEEFEQIHRLNYRTFVREIPQHTDPGTGRLVDKFHDKNRYLICVKNGEVVGMLSAHDRPPFSVADRLPDPGVLTRDGVRPVEIRLLAVVPEERKSPAMIGMVFALQRYVRERGFTHFVASAVVEQMPLYEHLGFEPLGPAVGTGRAMFVPMWLPLPRLDEAMGRTIQLMEKRFPRTAERANGGRGERATAAVLDAPDGRHTDPAFLTPPPAHPPTRSSSDEPVCLLPGPVALSPEVRAAFREPIVYHRADEFLPLFERVRSRLAALAGGTKRVALFVGSGTLANEAVAATLAADPARDRGLVLVNGEFGGRLLKQAHRWGLSPATLTWDWGRPWDLDRVEAALAGAPAGGWVWAVHHETSTGVQNDLAGLVAVADKYAQRVCVDCVSSLGTVPADLSGVYLATGASGKAVRSYPGLAFVFADPAALTHLDPERVPAYLDVAATLGTVGPRFTVPSPLVRALDAALEPLATADGLAARLAEVSALGRHLRDRLTAAGLEPLAPAAVANPSIVTFAPPAGLSAADFVSACRGWGYQVAGQSGYLAERRLVQLAVMGAVTRDQIDPLLDKLEQ